MYGVVIHCPEWTHMRVAEREGFEPSIRLESV
jgi:hypothetical protein